MKLELEEIVRMNDASPLDLFKQGMKSEETKDKYARMLKLVTCEFFEDVLKGSFEERVAQLVKESREDPDWARDLLISLSAKLRKRTELPKGDKDYLNPDSLANYYRPLKKLFDMNDVHLSWKRIYATYPESNDKPDSRGWTRDEIALMLKNAGDSTSRALILVLASSGVRVGGLEGLNWGDVTPVYKVDGKLTMDPGIEDGDVACAMLGVYRGSSEHYNTFITPEAYTAVHEYGRKWEYLKNRPAQEDDPVFITHSGIPKRAGHVLIRKRLNRVANKAGVHGKKNGKRFGVPILQGFRRFWNKTCKEAVAGDSRVASLIQIEYMLGHRGLVALDQNYYKTNALELAEAYVEIVPDLTFDNDLKLKHSNELMSANIRKMEDEQGSTIAELEKKVADLEQQNQEIKAEKDAVSGADSKLVADLARRLQSQDETMKKMDAKHAGEMEELKKLITGMLGPAKRGRAPKSAYEVVRAAEESEIGSFGAYTGKEEDPPSD